MEYVALVVALFAVVSAFYRTKQLRELESESDLEFDVLHERIDGMISDVRNTNERIDLVRDDLNVAYIEISKRAMSRKPATRKTLLPPPPDEVVELSDADLIPENDNDVNDGPTTVRDSDWS